MNPVNFEDMNCIFKAEGCGDLPALKTDKHIVSCWEMTEKEKSKSVSITITRESSIHLQKMLGIERISRKRFIKLLMGCRIQRNDANIFADIVRKNEYGYCPITVQAVIEWVIKEIQKGEE